MSNDFNALVEKYKKKQSGNQLGVKDRSGTVTVQPASTSQYSSGSPGRSSSEDEFFGLVEKYKTKEKEKKYEYVSNRSKRKKEEEKEDDGLDFFQKGSFEDGYQFGDVSKAILGTAGDAGLNVVKGVGGLVEGLVDLADYGVAGAADLFGADKYADNLRKLAQTNMVDKWTKGASDYLDQYSVLGRTSDSVMQGVGQVGAIIATGGMGAAAGLGSAGVTALTTGVMGLSGMGSGMGEAYEGGANDLQALKHGLNTGATDAISELIFGGLGKSINALGISRGLSSADDMLAKLIGSKFKGQAAKNLVEFGIKAGAEGLEEVIAGVAQAYSKYHNYLEEQGVDFIDVLKDEKLLEQFVVGAFTSGIAQAPSLHVANSTKTDFITGQTQSEEAVVKREIEKRIAKAEEKGNKLTAKEKGNIEAEVERALERGYISTDTIEEVLGGEAYSAYDSLVKESEEFKTLYETEGGKLSEKQRDRLAELKAKNQKTSYESAIKEARKNLFREGFTKSQNSRLAESYMELSRKGQDFQADLSKYKSESAKKTVQNILDSGLANNSNEFHDFVDLLTNISEGRGTVFNITDNDSLKGTEHYKEGFITDGFITADDGSITINLDSPKALSFITGHEVTHSLEKSNFYADLQKAVFQYAEDKGDLADLRKSVEGRYKSLDKVGQDKELTSDLVGRYLFTDYDFISNLSTNHRNVFQKVFDEIKYLCKMATAGSKAARDLERVKHQFEKAYRENVNGKPEVETQTEMEGDVDGVQYSVTVEDKETLDSLNEQLQKGEVTKVYRAMQVQPVDENGEVIKATVLRVVSQSPLMVEAKTFGKDGKVDVYPAKLFSPMAGMVNGKWSKDIELNKWEQTTYDLANAYTVIDEKTGQPKIDTTKKNASYGEVAYFYGLVKGGIDDSGKPLTNVPARYNPYIHTSLSALNDQFSSANKRPELVTVECIIPNSELTSGERAEGAKDRVGAMSWHSGPTSSRLAKVGKARTVILTRYDMPVRVLPDSEVAKAVADYIGDTENIAIKGSTVTPSLSQELMNLGISVLNDEQWSQYDKDFPTKTFGKKKGKTQYSMTPEMERDAKDVISNLKREVFASKYGLHKFASYTAERIDREIADSMADGLPDYAHSYIAWVDPEDFLRATTTGQEDYERIRSEAGELNYDSLKGETIPIYLHVDGKTNQIVGHEGRHRISALGKAGYDRVAVIVRTDSPNAVGQLLFPERSMKLKGQVFTNDIAGTSRKGIDFWLHDLLPLSEKYADTAKKLFSEVEGSTRYSVSKQTDSDGRELSPAVAKRFGNSKVVDDHGKLKAVFHGTASGEFTVFDKAKGNVEGDFGSGFYFTDNESDVSNNYEGGGPDFENKVARLAEQIEQEEDIDYEEAKERARAELFKGSHKFEVYLNIEKPAVVGETILFDGESYYEQFNEEDYDDYDDYIADMEQAVADDISQIIWDVEQKVDVYGTLDELSGVLFEAYSDGGMGIEELKARINDLYLEDNEGNLVGNEVARQVIESLGYDGIIDPTVSGKWNMDMEEGTTHYIVFKPNQIKNVTNQNPTDNPDIRYSVSEQTDKDYMDAVFNGDDETAQKLLDKAAKKAGYKKAVYHGTSADFTVFDTDEESTNREVHAWNAEYPDGTIFVAEDIDVASYYGHNVMPLYLNTEGMKTFVHKDMPAHKAMDDLHGYAVMEYPVIAVKGNDMTIYATLDNTRLKSAELVTVDDDGAVIPLSERFNTKNEDIRYSMSETTDSEGNQLTREQEEFFKDSKLRDKSGNLLKVYHGTTNKFTTFRQNKADGWGTGIYFTDNRAEANTYGENVVEAYLNIQNPYDADTMNYYDIGAENTKAYRDYDMEVWKKRYDEYDTYEEYKADGQGVDMYDIYAEEVEVFNKILRELGYDGIIADGSNGIDGLEIVAFKENQPKLTSNTNPTSDPDIRHSLTGDEGYDEYGSYNVYGKDVKVQSTDDFAPIRDDIQTTEKSSAAEVAPEVDIPEKTTDDLPIDVTKSPVLKRLNEKLSNSNTELAKIQKLRDESKASFDEKIATAKAQLDSKKNKDTKVANNLKRRIERLERLKGDRDAEYVKRIGDIKGRIVRTEAEIRNYHPGLDRAEKAIARIDKMLEMDKADLDAEFAQKREAIADKNSYISEKASELYKEIRGLKKGVRASEQLAYLLDHGYDWSSIRSALVNIKHTPGETVNINSEAESVAREMLNEDYEQAQYDLDDEYHTRLSALESEAETKRKSARVANQRIVKQQEYAEQMENLIGDTTTWVDKKMGISYKVNTLRRNLRDIVRDAQGKRDIAKADAIYDELQGKYNHNEAMLHREANRIKSPYADLKITDAEDAYIQMLGELRHNPDTTLTADAVNEFYEKHKNKIDTDKVDQVIASARETYDTLLQRVNEALREQGMKEIPYRQGYFPHFTDPKQGWLAKLLNWKVKDFTIPTDIAGLTEQFNPNRSWQAFNKERKSDTTDYSFKKGLDTYVQGALDWVYHIEDIQKRRAFENHIRYVHSEKGIQARIDAIRKNTEYDADEMQEQIDLVYKEAGNPLNNFVTDLRAGTNTLANKKSSLDRGMEELVNRKVYSTMTNLSNRVSGNMVAGSISSALTNFIPITQSWMEVSPVSSLRAMGDTIKSAVRDDGTIEKSDFLTNRLRQSESLYKTGWDKVSDKVGFLMEAVDSFTSQTVWRSKYLENISKGMSESEAIKNADQFAENVMAGRSRGNMPTIFDSKNPLFKTLTAFQLEVNNQYEYFFKDAPQDLKNESVGKLIKGYATAFLGAYAYNALYSSLVGRDAAFDPIGIIEEFLKDLFGDDDDEEPVDAILGLTDNIMEEVPFVGGLLGGGRIPISSALPYDGVYEAFKGTVEDVASEDWENLTNEWLNPLWYLAMPLGGGQIRKTIQGLGMFDDDLPISGSYTSSGKLRFPVEDTFGNRVKAGLFGQYASKNARDYFDNGRSPLGEAQIQEFMDVDIPIRDYWEYREGLRGLSKIGEKADYIDSLDLPIDKKNLLINNIADREEPIDLTGYGNYNSFDEFEFAKENPEKYKIAKAVGGYERYMTFREGMKDMKFAEKVDYVAGLNLTTQQKNILINGETDRKEPIDLTGYEGFNSYEEFEYAKKNPENYAVAKAVGGYDAYKQYSDDLNDIKADKDKYGKSISGSRKTKVMNYIDSLDADYYTKLILYKSEYTSYDDENYEIIEYLNSRNDISFEEEVAILRKLGFKVTDDGNISW
jgi:hypothetical protein